MQSIMQKLFSVLLLLQLAVPMIVYAKPSCSPQEWPLWVDFRKQFVQESGRVLDASTLQLHSSSESQSYGMFFALVAGDRNTFDKLWQWSVNNLGEGDFEKRLPAWLWGQASDKSWRILDPNSASDADLWFVYALLEAGRLWKKPQYTLAAHQLLALIESHEVEELPGLGTMLMPGKEGFINRASQTWRLNPSYLPLPLLRRLHHESPSGPWNTIASNTVKMISATSPKGLAPDWVSYQAKKAPSSFMIDPFKGPTGSYDAIRTYLWAGMTSVQDPLFASVSKSLDGMVKVTTTGQGIPPEKINTLTGTTQGEASFGFSAALIPYFKTNKQTHLLNQQKRRVQAHLRKWSMPDSPQQTSPPYYDYVLSLFGMGWLEGHYRFKANGTLSLPREKKCFSVTTK